MKTYKLIPQLREGCIIQGKVEWLDEFKVGDVVFLISNSPTKKYSIISRIEALENAEDPKIFADTRNLGKFAENDEVYILKYNPAEALEIYINISNEYAIISKGDWTSNIKPSVIGKLIDVGQEISFLISWEGGAPIVCTGIVNSTLPNPPIFVGQKTRIFIEKKSIDNLSRIQREKLKSHEDRVDILEKQIKLNTIQFIRTIKQKNYPNKGQKYDFKAVNPSQLFNSVLNIFRGLEIIEEPTEQSFVDKSQDYLASAVFQISQNGVFFQLIDIQIVARENSGTLIIWVTGEDELKISETIDRYNAQISKLKQGLEPKAQVLSASCPECGADLPFRDITIDGIVECVYCGKISKIPKVLRY